VIRGMLQRAEQRGRWQGWGGPKALAEGATKNMSRGRRASGSGHTTEWSSDILVATWGISLGEKIKQLEG